MRRRVARCKLRERERALGGRNDERRDYARSDPRAAWTSSPVMERRWPCGSTAKGPPLYSSTAAQVSIRPSVPSCRAAPARHHVCDGPPRLGASGDTAPYAIEREFEDVAAVVDAVAARTGGPVALWGHSYGCNPAMGGAALTGNVHHLILYEPSFGLTYPPGAIEAIERAVADGDRERAIRAAFVDTGVMTDEDFLAFKASPRWPSVIASAPTLPRECRVEDGWRYEPGQFDGISAPALC